MSQTAPHASDKGPRITLVNEYMDANRGYWDEVVPIHVASDFYDLPSFKSGESSLMALERQEVGDVRGKTLLHLQCHFGLDALSWAREGAGVTGMDFSPSAVDVARKLAAETGIEARFLVSDLYELPERLDGQFDIVFTSYGVINWLPDLARWAQVIAHFLKAGGVFYIVEFHPVQHALEIIQDNPDVDELRFRWPYFATPEPLRFDEDGSYANRAASLNNRTNYVFPHSLGEVVTSLVEAGLQIEFLHEFPFDLQKHFPFMRRRDDGYWDLTKPGVSAPLLFSIRASKPL
jgi:SAM-dependent methyltransferase